MDHYRHLQMDLTISITTIRIAITVIIRLAITNTQVVTITIQMATNIDLSTDLYLDSNSKQTISLIYSKVTNQSHSNLIFYFQPFD